MRKLNTNKIHVLHRICLRNYNPEKLPEDNYQEAQWQIDDKKDILEDDLYTLARRMNLKDTYLTLVSYILIPNQAILMKITHRDQLLLLSRAPILMTQVMLKTGKSAPLLTDL